MSTKGIAARLRGNKPSPPKSSPVYTPPKKAPTVPQVPTDNQFPSLAGVVAAAAVVVPAPVPAQVPVVPTSNPPVRGAWANGIDSIRQATEWHRLQSVTGRDPAGVQRL